MPIDQEAFAQLRAAMRRPVPRRRAPVVPPLPELVRRLDLVRAERGGAAG